MMQRTLMFFARAAAVGCAATGLPAQARRADTLRLPALEAAAFRHDPRRRELDLLRAQSVLRLENIAAARRPGLSVSSTGQYQSVVASLPVTLPGGVSIPTPRHDSYDAALLVSQAVIDPGIRAARVAEIANARQAEAHVNTVRYATRRNVDDAFFDAARVQARRAAIAAAIADLQAQQSLVEAKVNAGTALSGDAAAVTAELLRRRQDDAEARAQLRAALAVLGDLVGSRFSEGDVLVIPAFDSTVGRTGDTLDPRARPEYAEFARTRDALHARDAAVVASVRPKVSAFAKIGYGRPGLDFLSTRFDQYWLGGLQLQWTPWRWNSDRRERDEIDLQREIVTTEETAFSEAIQRDLARDVEAIDRLASTLATDEEIVALREQIVRETRARFEAGVVTAAEYVDRQSDLLNARIAGSAHRVELAQARAHYLTTLGLDLR